MLGHTVKIIFKKNKSCSAYGASDSVLCLLETAAPPWDRHNGLYLAQTQPQDKKRQEKGKTRGEQISSPQSSNRFIIKILFAYSGMREVLCPRLLMLTKSTCDAVLTTLLNCTNHTGSIIGRSFSMNCCGGRELHISLANLPSLDIKVLWLFTQRSFRKNSAPRLT